MSVYPPPNYTEPISVFNPVNWETSETAITIEYLNTHFLKYPVAQGLETLQEIVVNGASTFNNSLDINNYNINDVGQLTFYNSGTPKTQTSAYTGGQAGTYTNTSMTIDANGKISAISSGATSTGFTSGMIVPFGGVNAPSGFLMCDGSQVSQTTYSSLFSVIGTYYQNGQTPTAGNFFLPDFRSRTIMGSQSTNPINGVLVNGGLSNIVYNPSIYGGNKTIASNQVAPHTHNLSWNTSNYVSSTNNTNNTTTGGSSTRLVSDNTSAFPTASGSQTNFFNFQGQGDYLPPFCSTNFIIKT